MTINEIIQRAHAEVGTKEIPANSNNVKYNTWYYGKAVSGSAYPWCCAFVSWLFRDHQNISKKSASCINLLSWFEKNGQIVTKPQAGDVVFFKFPRNNTRTNHVGIVVGIEGNKIHTIEGNTSVTSDDNGGSVMQRVRTSSIVAYARPNYDDAWIQVQKGSKGTFVKKLQHILNTQYNKRLDEDGVFGQLTFNAVVSVQAMLNDASGKPLVKDGIVGEKTWRAIMSKIRF